jgi:hypothetical protein
MVLIVAFGAEVSEHSLNKFAVFYNSNSFTQKLKLKVNEAKSAVARPQER